jgi:hypothetical protein
MRLELVGTPNERTSGRRYDQQPDMKKPAESTPAGFRDWRSAFAVVPPNPLRAGPVIWLLASAVRQTASVSRRYPCTAEGAPPGAASGSLVAA